jgi:SAM-dependent methyltransferase
MMATFSNYANYYDLFYQEKDYAGEAEEIHKLLSDKNSKIGTILDLGSGTGRHAIELARKGYTVHGVDNSPRMVEIAKQAVPDNLQKKLSFQTADARFVTLPRKYDAVISLFHVMSYQVSDNDVESFLNNVSRHIKKGGTFIFDFWCGPGVMKSPPEKRESSFQDDRYFIKRVAEPDLDIKNNRVEVSYTISLKSKTTGREQDFNERHLLRFFFLEEVCSFLENAGFSLVSSSDGKTGEKLDSSSWSGAVHAQKYDYDG